jgi:MerR family transcriptional regulator, copper efflux regulator
VATGAFVRARARLLGNGNSASGHGPRLLTIGEVARRSGFTVKALRFYDHRGLLPPCGRRPSGYRLYSESDLHRLEFIRQAKVLGLTLDAIRDLVAAAREPGGARVRPWLLRMLSDRITQTGRQIAALTDLRRELERRRRRLASRRGNETGRGYCTCLHKGQATSRTALEREARWSQLHTKTGTR